MKATELRLRIDMLEMRGKGAGSAGGAETISVPDWRNKESNRGGRRAAISASISAEWLFNPVSLLSRTDGEFEKGLRLGKLLSRVNAWLKLCKSSESVVERKTR